MCNATYTGRKWVLKGKVCSIICEQRKSMKNWCEYEENVKVELLKINEENKVFKKPLLK